MFWSGYCFLNVLLKWLYWWEKYYFYFYVLYFLCTLFLHNRFSLLCLCFVLLCLMLFSMFTLCLCVYILFSMFTLFVCVCILCFRAFVLSFCVSVFAFCFNVYLQCESTTSSTTLTYYSFQTLLLLKSNVPRFGEIKQ